ncbi:MAG: DUF4112 domain-containing protein [Pirellulales bacterium]
MIPARTPGRYEVDPRLDDLSRWTDSVFRVPGLGWRFGWDPLIGLIPGIGDTATTLISLYILTAAARKGVSRGTMLRMAMNVAVDYLVGSIPLVGDLFDAYWKANQRNVALLRRRVEAGPAEARKASRGDWLFTAGLIAALLLLLAASIAVAWWLLIAFVEGISAAWHRA